MQKTLVFCLLLSISGCTPYPTTTFWVQNNSDREVHFTATAYKIHFEEMTLPFKVAPNNKVLLRQIGMSEQGTIKSVFSRINFMNTDSLVSKDPMDPVNWIKTADEKGNPAYTFTIEPKKP